MSDMNEKQVNIEEAVARMTSMEPYHCSPFDNPAQLRRKASDLLKALESLTDEDENEKIMVTVQSPPPKCYAFRRCGVSAK